jgi:hypothetical protein
VPLVPDVPLEPDVPLLPEAPLVPEAPLLPELAPPEPDELPEDPGSVSFDVDPVPPPEQAA